MPWCDALSRPVAHSASLRTAHGYALVTTQEQWKSHASVVEGEARGVHAARSLRALLAPERAPGELVHAHKINIVSSYKAYNTRLNNGL